MDRFTPEKRSKIMSAIHSRDTLPEIVVCKWLFARGLWGSIWSRCGRTASPGLVPTLLKSVSLWCFVAPFKPRRKVTIRIEDLTDRVREWSSLSRLEFNRNLEDWYNVR